MKKSKLASKGFSLIELLIVAMLIGVLTSIIIVIINPATIRARGRDSQRTTDLRTIQTALEQFYLKHRGYPSSATAASGCDDDSSVPSTCFIKITGSLVAAASRDRMTSCLVNSSSSSCGSLTNYAPVTNSIPFDPTNTSTSESPCNYGTVTGYYYVAAFRASNTQLADSYVLTANMETASANDGYECNSTNLRNWSRWGLCGAAGGGNCYGVENK